MSGEVIVIGRRWLAGTGGWWYSRTTYQLPTTQTDRQTDIRPKCISPVSP